MEAGAGGRLTTARYRPTTRSVGLEIVDRSRPLGQRQPATEKPILMLEMRAISPGPGHPCSVWNPDFTLPASPLRRFYLYREGR